jgi:predicted molibdopterin-dependent oxidoreductase YjgC
VIEACRQQGIEIPTMCYLDGHPHFTSCMVCVVKDVKLGRLIPACSAPVTDGMVLETDAEDVNDARRVAVELLLSEHVGDCEGPCERVCPAQIHIPAVLHHIATGDRDGAGKIYRMSQTQPGIPCIECNGRCEKPCRRKSIDDSVSIRLLMIYAAQGVPGQHESSRRPKLFNSIIGPISDEEKETVIAHAEKCGRIEPADGDNFDPKEAAREANRCLHCDCRKQVSCRLRKYADLYESKQSRYRPSQRKPIEIICQHPTVIFEPGKCIKCGICVKITEAAKEKFGMAFLCRGYDCTVGVPFGEPLDAGLTSTAEECVACCPTGALAHPEGESPVSEI